MLVDKLIGFVIDLFYNGWLSFGIFILTVAVAFAQFLFIKYKKKRIFTPIRILLGGTFISGIIFFAPILQEHLASPTDPSWLKAWLNAIQFSFRLFVLDGEILWIFEEELALLSDPDVEQMYAFIGSIYYSVAPILTFGFVLSFFNSVIASVRYFFAGLSHTHVFSELNEKTLALATDIVKHSKILSLDKIDGKWKLTFSKRDVVVFTEISDKVKEDNLDLVEDARMIGAILFSKDFDSVIFKRKRSPREIDFYLISEDEQKKLRHAEVVINNFDYKNVTLHLFSADIRSELLMAASEIRNVRVVRIDDIQTLIYHNLYTHGKMLFTRAREVEGKEEKIISAVIVGLGMYGKEMLKALSWFCQLKGYKLKINAFDSDKDAEEKFKFACPDLMSEKYNRVEHPNDAYYDITIHSGIDVSTPKFREKIEQITDATYIFVCLGTDDVNLKTAIDIRSICEGMSFSPFYHEPDIETVIYDSKLARSVSTTWDALASEGEAGVTNFKGEHYNILVTGDLESFYSVNTLIDSKLIAAGFEIQLGYSAGNDPIKKKDPKVIKAAERVFWKYEYNHNSSIAKAIHLKLRRDMGYVDTDEDWKKLSLEEKVILANPEHIRWNAYMRSIGYRKGDRRNDLAKAHNCLVSTDKLGDEDLRKD